MTHDEMIEIIEALRGGKSVQYRLHGSTRWFDGTPGALPNFGTFEYRVKPVPRVLWVNYSDSDVICAAYPTEQLASYTSHGVIPSKFVEVVE